MEDALNKLRYLLVPPGTIYLFLVPPGTLSSTFLESALSNISTTRRM
jgi:hypothetical protein